MTIKMHLSFCAGCSCCWQSEQQTLISEGNLLEGPSVWIKGHIILCNLDF